MVLLMETNAVNPYQGWLFLGAGRCHPQCTPPKFNSLPLKNDGLKFEDYITFLLGPGNFSGANRETSGV